MGRSPHEQIASEWVKRHDKPGLNYRKLYEAYLGKSA